MKSKISIIGAGRVGSTLACKIIEAEIAEVVLIDNKPGLAEGKSLDILHSEPLDNTSCKITGSEDYSKIAGSSIIVITAGISRKPGMTREDLIVTNAKIVSSVADNVVKYAPDAVVIMVTNPLDLMCYLFYKRTGFSANRIIGMGGILDAARYKAAIAKKLNINFTQVHALVIGTHGSGMLPLPECTSVTGIPVKKLLSRQELDEIGENTVNAGAEIVELLKTESAYVAPAAAIFKAIKGILNNNGYISCDSVYLNGEYGIKDIFIGVPVILGQNGVEQILDIKIRTTHLDKLHKIAAEIKESTKLISQYFKE